MERWVPIAGQEGRYDVSSLGRVRSLDRDVVYSDGRVGRFKGVTLTPSRGLNGYLIVSIDRGKRHLVHRLVAAAFLQPPASGGSVVNHINGDKRDNRVENLEWSTPAENNRHARASLLNRQNGEQCNLTRYSDQLVASIRRVNERYSPTFRELALLFDVSEMQVSSIVKGTTRAPPDRVAVRQP